MTQVDQAGTAKRGAPPDSAPRFSWRRVRTVFLRVLALGILGYGIVSWAYILGATDLGGAPFLDQRTPAKNAIAAYAAVDLVAAIGLWMTSAWGVVLWILNTAVRVLLHTAYSDVHGGNPVLTGVEIAMVVTYVVLAVLAWREEKREELISRLRRRQNQNAI